MNPIINLFVLLILCEQFLDMTHAIYMSVHVLKQN